MIERLYALPSRGLTTTTTEGGYRVGQAKPTRCIPRVFTVLAADYWAPALANIGLLPLRFRDTQIESDYVQILSASMRPAITLVSILSLVFNLGCLAMTYAFARATQTRSILDHSYRWAFPCLIFQSLLPLLLLYTSHTHAGGSLLERCAATSFLLSAFVDCLWMSGNLELIHLLGERSDTLLAMHYRYIIAGASFSQLVMYIMFLCVNLRVRCKVAGPSALVVQMLLLTICILTTRVNQNRSYSRAIWLLVAMYALLAISNVTAAYCNELSDRVSYIVMRQASDTVLRARHTRHYITKSGLPVSPLETLVRDLRKVQTMVDQVKGEDGDGQQYRLLTIVAIDLTEILRVLTKGSTLQSRDRTERPGDDLDEAAQRFHSLYDTERMCKTWDTSRKRESSMFKVAYENEGLGTCPNACARAENLDHHMDAHLASRIGSDLSLTYTELAAYKDSVIFEVGYILMRPLLSVLGCTCLCLKKWLKILEFSSLAKQPYHNPLQIALSAHTCIATLRAVGIYKELTDAEAVAVTIAALGRFLTQTGRSDSFFIRSNALLAILFSDRDAVQSMSLQCLLRTLSVCPESNILAEVNEDCWRDIRHFIAELIIDMSYSRHFANLSRIRVLRHAPDQSQLQHRQTIRRAMCTAAMKVAAAPQMFLPWAEQLNWGLRWAEERYQQGEDERTLGLKVSPLNDRKYHHNFGKTVMDYVTVMWMPMWQELCRHDASHEFFKKTSKHLEESMSHWAELSCSPEKMEIPDEVRQLKIGSPLIPIYLSARLWRAQTYTDAFAEAIKLNLVEE